jgi:hypothetical protein
MNVVSFACWLLRHTTASVTQSLYVIIEAMDHEATRHGAAVAAAM